MMPPIGLQIYIRPRVTLTFDLLHVVVTQLGICRNMFLPGLVKSRQHDLEMSY